MRKTVAVMTGVALVGAAVAYVLWVRWVTEWDEQESQ